MNPKPVLRRWGAVSAAVVVALAAVAYGRADTSLAGSEPATKLEYRPCPAETTAALPDTKIVCGTVTVPLDRSRPRSSSNATIPIAFQLYPASDTASATSGTIVPSSGGPGVSNIALGPVWLGMLGPILDRRNLLLIDHRGMGGSGAIDCPGLQHVQGDRLAAARDCGARLGEHAYRYGSADVADDIDAVRQALGINKVDYYGISYGSVDVRAYAYRHPDRLRSAILDSPFNSADEALLRNLPGAMARISTLICQRSTACSQGNPDPRRTFDDLVHRVQRQPVRGTGYDANGAPHELVVDERMLLGILYHQYFGDPAFLNQGELFAAAEALKRGDPAPLLRLAAESPTPPDFGDSAGQVSVGATYATYCVDSDLPWDKSDPEPARRLQYDAYLRRIPANETAPFTASAWATFMGEEPWVLVPGGDACSVWPAPPPRRPQPPFPANQKFPANIPAVLFGGGYDYLDAAGERALLSVFPGKTFVEITHAGHAATAWSACGNQIALNFLQTLQVGDTGCAGRTDGALHNPFSPVATGISQLQGVAAFPLRAADLPQAADDPMVRGSGSPQLKRIGSATASTILDAMYRLPRITGTEGRGLRGGSYQVTRNETATVVEFDRTKFTTDVEISGKVTIAKDNTLSGTVTVAGPNGVNGSLTAQGILWDPARPKLSLRGSLGGNPTALLTPTG